MLEVKNVGEVSRAIDEWLEQAEQDTTKWCKAVTVAIFNQVLQNSPQYSGDFVANWKYQLNSVDTSYEVDILGTEAQVWPFGKPEKGAFKAKLNVDRAGLDYGEAPAYALRKNRGRDAGFKLGDVVYISNSSVHDIAYAPHIEKGTIYLRVKGTAAPLERAVDHVVGKVASGVFTSRWSQLDSLRRRVSYG